MDYHQQYHVELGVPVNSGLNHRKCMKCGREWPFLKVMEDIEKLIAEELIEALWSDEKK